MVAVANVTEGHFGMVSVVAGDGTVGVVENSLAELETKRQGQFPIRLFVVRDQFLPELGSSSARMLCAVRRGLPLLMDPAGLGDRVRLR